ncbi:DUF488 domain-containing protein [Jiangella rhizosphaerae]|uniref:DUF488 domain-containing protein n=1 Tax=Jiangella rhizosphaerae TaxID=2293569 RepID=A0A418KKQ5_9ACTN|nr:DUF488 domain-containing protein [Jiangella rhizosphaerae]RIQ16673.1 DUF488 domain-containing protein [Jiangella rhizosphaerae]
MGVIGVGYEGHTIDSFVAGLAASGVGLVADVRLTPMSRKTGFSKRGLAAALAAAGIDYVHLPALGNPKDNRVPFAAGDPAARRRYAERLAEPEGREALDLLAAESAKRLVALLCLEADQSRCHRQMVLDRLGAAGPA